MLKLKNKRTWQFTRIIDESGKAYGGQTVNPVERRREHKRGDMWKHLVKPKFEVMYWCLKRNAAFYEKREIHDLVESDLECLNKQHNYKLNELEVPMTEEFVKEIKKRELPKGVSITKYGKYRVDKVVSGKRYIKNCDTLALAIEFLECI